MNVVTAYLGPNAGRRVLAGQIQRGDGETIHAVIWYSDLRGSTPMADALPRDDYIRTLNDYFECAGGAVLAQDGEIVAFIGDAVLAISLSTKTRMPRPLPANVPWPPVTRRKVNSRP